MGNATMELKYPAASMTPDETPKDAGKGYCLVKNLIFDQVHKFRRRYGGDVEELTGEANLAFVKGHKQFITGYQAKGKAFTDPYATVIRRWVWYEMFDNMRTRLRRNSITKMEGFIEGQEFPSRAIEWDVVEWTDELSDDARMIAELILDPPENIEDTATKMGGEPRNYRSTVRAYLQGDLGWKPERISDAFSEIRRALG